MRIKILAHPTNPDSLLREGELPGLLSDSIGIVPEPSDSLQLVKNDGIHEKGILAHLSSLIKWDDIIIDIGAHIGYFSVIFGKLVGPGGRVYAFEPDPMLCGYLRTNASINNLSNIVIENCAVAEAVGDYPLYYCENTGDGRIYDSGDGRQRIIVPGVSLHRYFRGATLDLDDCILFNGRARKINLIKMDIQGAEGWALRGMQMLLRRSVEKIIMEFWPTGLKRSGIMPEEILILLNRCGFQFWDMRHDGNLWPTSPAELLNRYPVKPEIHDIRLEDFTNLLCVKTKPDKWMD